MRRATDLGCGTGLSTQLLRQRWPAAQLTGIDISPAMLEEARHRVSGVEWRCQSIADFAPDTPQDLLFANASLQWLPDHPSLLRRLLETLNPGGVFAMQVPDNLGEPSHVAMREVAQRPPYGVRHDAVNSERRQLLSVVEYYDHLRSYCDDIEIWLTRYHHALPGIASVYDWYATTGLKPWLDALTHEQQRAAFREEYLEAIAPAYPAQVDGCVLLIIPRLFLVARRRP